MKKIIWLAVVFAMLFTACGNNDADRQDANGTDNGVVTDGDGVIDENNGDAKDDNIVDDAADGAADIVDGATDAVDDAVGGVKNTVDDMTDGTNNSASNANNNTSSK